MADDLDAAQGMESPMAGTPAGDSWDAPLDGGAEDGTPDGPPEDGAVSPDADQSEREVRRRVELRTREVASLLGPALRGDRDAQARLEADRAGRRALRDATAAADERAATYARARAEVDRLARLRDDDPESFAREMADAETMRRFAYWSGQVGPDEGANRASTAGMGRTTGATPQGAGDEALEAEFDVFLRTDDARLLSDDDLEAVDPARFADAPPAVAALRWEREVRRRVEAAKGGAQAQAQGTGTQAQTQPNRPRPPVRGGVPVPAGRASGPARDFRAVQADWIASYRNGTNTAALDQEYFRSKTAYEAQRRAQGR